MIVASNLQQLQTITNKALYMAPQETPKHAHSISKCDIDKRYQPKRICFRQITFNCQILNTQISFKTFLRGNAEGPIWEGWQAAKSGVETNLKRNSKQTLVGDARATSFPARVYYCSRNITPRNVIWDLHFTQRRFNLARAITALSWPGMSKAIRVTL